MKRTTAKNKVRNDVVFILAIILIALLMGGLWIVLREQGSAVRITVNGEVVGEYSLAQDQTVEIPFGDGAAHNLLVIENGMARMREADCPDGICVAHRPIQKEGDSIVCLPNKVVVTVICDGDDAPDVVV